MRTFAYRGFDAAGRTARGLIEALDIKEAREKLSARGILPESVEDAATAAPSGRSRVKLDLADRSAVFRRLGVLLASGLPLASALDVLVQSPERPGSERILASVRDRIRGGQSLAEALAQSSPEVSRFELAVVRAGERAGNLDHVMEQLANYLDEQCVLRDGLRSAMMYPLFVIGLAVLVAAGMFGFVVPSLMKFFHESGVPLPLLTRIVMKLANTFPIWGTMAAAAGVAAWISIRRRYRNREGREPIEMRLFGSRLLGRPLALSCAVRFARTMTLLLRGGVPLVDAMEMSGAATGSVWLERMLREEADHVRHGRSFADALQAVPPLAPHLAGWVRAGEASGQLDRLLHAAGDRLQQQWTTYLQRTLSLIGPVLVVIVGLFVLLIALAILMPMLSLSSMAR